MYKTCGCCGKKFYVPYDMDIGEYLYKRKLREKMVYFCRYTCWMSEGQKKTNRRYTVSARNS